MPLFYNSKKQDSSRKMAYSATQFFKIESPAGHVSYLLGTMHKTSLPLSAVAQHLTTPLKVLPYIDSVYAEINLQDSQNSSDLDEFLDRANPDANPAINFLTEDTYNILFNRIAEHVPNRLNEVKKLSLADFAYATYLSINWEPKSKHSMAKMSCTKTIDVERMFVNKAKELSKKVGGLEDNTRQFMFSGASASQVIKGLEEAAMQEKSRRSMIYQCLLAVQSLSIADMIFRTTPDEERYFNHRLTTDSVNDGAMLHRNHCMFLKMQNLMSDEKSLFMMGFAHLHGQTGLLKLFEEKGYRVTPLSNKNIHAEVETLKRQMLPIFIASVSFYFGVKTAVSSDLFGAMLGFIYSGLIAYGIYERTKFLQLNNIESSLLISKKEVQNDLNSTSTDLYETHDSKFSYC